MEFIAPYASPAQYLVVPKAAHESWDYLPTRFTDRIDAGNYWTIMRDAELYQFAILSSAMHMAWIKFVSGKSAYQARPTQGSSMRNFPWPIKHTQAQFAEIEVKAMEILQLRTKYMQMPLTDLYNPFSMPTDLYRAHFALDKAVDAAYSAEKFTSDSNRVEFLCNLDRRIANFMDSEAVFSTPNPLVTNSLAAKARPTAINPYLLDLIGGQPSTSTA